MDGGFQVTDNVQRYVSANDVYDAVERVIPNCYLVGGSVRDILIGRQPKDWDFCTPMLPDEIECRVKKAGRRAYIIGKRFGTIGFKVQLEDAYHLVEVTTFRKETYESGSRKPEVEFVTDLTHDLSRRDFTINAMAMQKKRLIDPFGGQEDMKKGLIRGVGNPTIRFKEDPLRMLRAFRFMGQFDYRLDNDTGAALQKRTHRILMVSRERWVDEMDKLLMTPYVSDALLGLAEIGLLKYLIPELHLQHNYNQNSPYHSMTLFNHTRMVVANSPKNIELRWAALLHDIAKPFVVTTHPKKLHSQYIKHDLVGAEFVEKIGLYLKWSNERREKVKDVVLNHLKDDCPIRDADKLAHGPKTAEKFVLGWKGEDDE